MYRKYFKRLFDVIFSVIAIIFLIPIYIIIGILVKINLGSPIIFKQTRVGKDEKTFNIYKFRSMTNEKNKNGELLSNEERLNKFGIILRSTSLDEIPELFNILKGEMSIVGPRPLLVKYLDYYNERERKRHSVFPGLTGLAQINGRNAIGWEERFKYDIEYSENVTFINDLKILFLTIKKVFFRENITMPKGREFDDFDVYRKAQIKNNDL
ncbi:lipopolysaccharide/colanic/teichoic acid biosynthesis glycosyltransferase [Clostridium moniliforme]|uniref:Lipopolysaccharide/colanic/teichoic acid biosynthesis glycosyltransferase n=1 Tax=Clostridium moniliforme TaxID=39489 RepID=A0ABS4EYU3_9CLOT|nr:sugar transferase [Clostridium moniliforme]MBP1889160.1 lipopolysaccharide/colanic/teichoic acid biosynthesis glycosyltransferase [Clostridium moniliforme]